MKHIQRTICHDEDQAKDLQGLTQIIVYPGLPPPIDPAHFACNGRLESGVILFLVGMI